jgi:hypothetical protein
MKIFLLSIVSLCMLLLSCQREINDVLRSASSCKITNGYYYYSSAGIYDSAIFTYDQDKISRVEGDEYFATYSYTGDNITGRKFFHKINNNALLTSDTIQYGSDNSVSKMISWFYPTSSLGDTVRIVYLFNYTGENVSSVIKQKTQFTLLGIEIDTVISTFYTNATGNTDYILMKSPQGGLYDSIHYTYDTKPNYFRAIHPYFFIFDPFFILHQDIVADFPYTMSKNNVLKFSYNFTGEDNAEYETDSLNNITAVDLSGSPYMRYKYQCP